MPGPLHITFGISAQTKAEIETSVNITENSPAQVVETALRLERLLDSLERRDGRILLAHPEDETQLNELPWEALFCDRRDHPKIRFDATLSENAVSHLETLIKRRGEFDHGALLDRAVSRLLQFQIHMYGGHRIYISSPQKEPRDLAPLL